MENNNAAVAEEIISANRVLEILNSNVVEVENLCKKASLKPRKDELGNIYFSKTDIDVLKKVKELYEHTKLVQETKKKNEQNASTNILARAKAKLKNELTTSEIRPNIQVQQAQLQKQMMEISMSKIQNSIEGLENKVISKMESLLSEKMDGLDEVVLELIRSKSENETLRGRINELNKENYALKAEVSSYKSLGIGLYVKKPTEEF